MRLNLTTILLLASLLQVSAITFAQTVTYSKKGATLEEIFSQISLQTGYEVLFSPDLINPNKRIDANFSSTALTAVLNQVMDHSTLRYKIEDKNILISKIKPANGVEQQETSFLHRLISQFRNINVKGTVVDSAGNKLAGATVTIRGTTKTVVTKDDGTFYIENVEEKAVIVISLVGYQTQEIPAKANLGIIQLRVGVAQLSDIQIVNTGYQSLPKERATGSFTSIDNALLNRSVSTNILDRLDGITSGLIFNRNRPTSDVPNNSAITIRGRSTLFANASPLIVIDNFPYEGDLSNVNPNDIESFTVLKDAAAASVWGARSGNGVIVITTKKGRLNTGPTVSLNFNTTIGKKPDLDYSPELNASQFIEAEQFLFDKGAYNTVINDGFSAITPAVEILLAQRNGTISGAEATVRLNTLRNYDYRDQLSKYFYRNSLSQQYQASVSGGGANQKYFISAGYDKNLSSNVGTDYSRLTLNASNTYYFLKNKLEFFSNIVYTSSKANSASLFVAPTPYTQLADENGNPVAIANTLSLKYAQSAGSGKLLDWLYKPLDELNNHYSSPETNLSDYRINLALSYNIIDGLKASILYGYERSISTTETVNELQSYYTRNLINTYSQINSSTGVVNYPVPLGAILDQNTTTLQLHNGRSQVSYDHLWSNHAFSGVAGFEIRSNQGDNQFSRYYGYNPETLGSQNFAVNYTGTYPYFYGSSSSQIGIGSGRSGSKNHFLSYYANGAYTFKNKYIVSASARRDESNIFGVSTNQKGVPLWSTGLAWIISKENFYGFSFLPELKLRATYGYTGNVSNSLSAYLTVLSPAGVNSYNTIYANINNPPNPSLRWEKIRNINLGIDFAIKGNRLNGSLDIWQKNGLDLIGSSPIAPQTGIVLYTGNSANTLAEGLDLQLNTVNFNGDLKWYTTFLYNYSSSKVTDYKVTNGSNLNVVSANYNNPLTGYPYYSVFSFKYAGLDNQGNPQGFLNGSLSNNYSAIVNSTNRDEIVYNGSATPTSFGSLRNTFVFKKIDFSFIISYRLGYYFRRVSLKSGTVYSSGFKSVTDYDQRWQKPGDELVTKVPSLTYPINNSRDALYTYSDVLVEKADNIRLQDVRLGYTFAKKAGLPFKNLNLFVLLSNVGIVWRANKHHLDPDYATGIPTVSTVAFGLRAEL